MLQFMMIDTSGRRWPIWASLAACVLMLTSGCEESESRSAATSAFAGPVQAERAGQPQPKLPTIKLWLGAEELIVEQARTSQEIQTGMMFRESMEENEGMLFIFAAPHRVSFWMKNTLLPLSCAYIDPDGIILEILDMKPLDETPLVAKSDRVQYVLETKQGWFERHNVKPGMLVRTEHGTLAETYQRGRLLRRSR